jgi:hypothetical protein
MSEETEMISFKEYINEAKNCPEGTSYCNKCKACVAKTCDEKALKEDATANKKQQLQRKQLMLNRQKLQLQMKAVQKKDQSQDMHMKEEKVKCPECKGDGCKHCDDKGYHIKESAWQRKEGKNKTGGLNEKGRKSYERENPGSDLKAPQPEGGPRKRSFCARMGGVKGPMKKPNGEPTRKALALRKWKC